jgi:hypothetical protein
MRRGSIFVILFIIVAAVVIGASQFLRSQPPIEITVAVDPLAQPWAESAIAALNATSPIVNATSRVQFRLVPTEDLDVWNGSSRWTPNSHPVAWIAASSASVDYAQDSGLPLVDVTPSLARTPLVWGGYASRVEVLTGDDLPLDWDAVQAAAEDESWGRIGGNADWGFLKLAFPQPGRKISGLAALFSGAGAYAGSPDLTGGGVRASDFRTWMLPVIESVPNFTTLGSDPGAAMARGTSTVDIGLFPEVQWLTNLGGMLNHEQVILNYPAYQFVLDFPLVRWQDSTTTVEQQQAVDLLRDWLSGAAQQANTTTYGLRSAAAEPTEADVLFTAGVPNGIQLTPAYGQAIIPPSRSDLQGLIEWAVTNQ